MNARKTVSYSKQLLKESEDEERQRQEAIAEARALLAEMTYQKHTGQLDTNIEAYQQDHAGHGSEFAEGDSVEEGNENSING